MGTNRFYRPSAPRYTSQFVEDRYPEDLILQSGAMKYAQKQQFAKDIGEFSALNNMLEPGYRTQEVAPVTKQKYNDALNNFITKYENNYDSPQALMELSQLRYSWLGDPDVQLIKQDREEGNKQYDDIRRSTKTYGMDYDPNVHPVYGTVSQFKSREPYRPYDPLIQFEDTDEYAFNMFNKVRGDVIEQPYRYTQKNPFTGLDEEVSGRRSVEFRDMNKLQPVVETLVQGVLNNTMPGAAYLKTKFRDENNNLRQPSEDELRSYFTEQAKKAQYSEVRGAESYKDISGAMAMQGEGDMATWDLPLSERQAVAEDISGRNLVKNRVANFFRRMTGKEEIDYKDTDDYLANIAQGIANNDPGFLSKSIGEQLKYIKQESEKVYRDKIPLKVDTPINPKIIEQMTQSFFGSNVQNDIIKSEKGLGLLFQGQTIYDYDTKEPIQKEKDKKKLLSEGNQIRILGTINDEVKHLAPEPGMLVLEINGKGYLVSNPNTREKERIDWNLNSPFAEPVTGMGNVFSMTISKNNTPMVTDKTDVRYEFDDAQVGSNEPDSYSKLFFMPMKDNFDDGEVKVKVYKKNPLAGKDGENTLLFNNNANKDFIKEYRYSDFNYNTEKLYQQILSDYPELVNIKYNK